MGHTERGLCEHHFNLRLGRCGEGGGVQDGVYIYIFLRETISSKVRNIDVGVERAWILVLVLRPISPHVRLVIHFLMYHASSFPHC